MLFAAHKIHHHRRPLTTQALKYMLHGAVGHAGGSLSGNKTSTVHVNITDGLLLLPHHVVEQRTSLEKTSKHCETQIAARKKEKKTTVEAVFGHVLASFYSVTTG